MDNETKSAQSWPDSAAQPPLAERRAAFGSRLRAQREGHSVTLPAMAQTTRIGQVFIEALESGAFDKLPGQVFGRGFVGSILKNLGVDSADLLKDFDSLWEKANSRSVLKVQIKNKPVRPRNETWANLIASSRSLVRRGVVVKVALPILAIACVIYGLVATPVLQKLARPWRGAAATMSTTPAKKLELTNSRSPLGQVADGASPPSAAAEPKAMATTTTVATAPGEKPVNQPVDTPAADAGEAVTQVSVTPEIVTGAGETDQVLELTVTEPVRIRLDVDQNPPVTKELKPDTYRFTFLQKADMMIYDAAAVKISFNGHPLGVLGNKGRIRRISFQAKPQSDKKL